MSTRGAATSTFGELLRRYRLSAALSQEALAERANLSRDAVRALELGRRRAPRPATLTLLAGALELGPAERDALIAAATGGASPEEARATPVTPVAPAAPADLPIHAPPLAPTPLIGRKRETAAVTHLFQRDGVRLLTLTGPGGVGKTRLALAVVDALRAAYADGVAFVDLSTLRDAALVPSAIAQALGLREVDARDAQAIVLAHLRDKQLLLALDNVEQVAGAAPLVTELVAACPCLAVLATSRTPLLVRAEQRFPVRPLDVPEDERPLPATAESYAAVRLFVARARAVRPDFALDGENAAAVAAICRRLDGLPLAIELAAARVALLSPRALLARLERRLPVLVGGARDLPDRQRTLRATIAWSYDLLTAEEQTLFRRLAVFAAGCTLDAAEAICEEEGGIGWREQGDASPNPRSCPQIALEGVTSLVDKSLLRKAGSADGEPRLAMLETVREYALEQLERGGEAPALRRRHAEYYLALAEAAEPELAGPRQAVWLARLEREHDNLRAALEWARETAGDPTGTAGDPTGTAGDPTGTAGDPTGTAGDPTERGGEIGLRLARALWRFWWLRGHLGEGRSRLEALLGCAMGVAPAVRAGALNGAGNLAWAQGDLGRAAVLHEAGLSLWREVGDPLGIAKSLNNLGLVARDQGTYSRGVSLFEESLALHRQEGNTRGVAGVLVNLGEVIYKQGDYGRAEALFVDGLALYQEMGDAWGIADTLHDLGDIAYDRGDYGRAQALLTDALTRCQEIGDQPSVAACLEDLAAVAVGRGQPRHAARLCGAAAALRAALGAPIPLSRRARYDRAVATARRSLGTGSQAGEGCFEEAWAAGATCPLEHVIGEALGTTT